MIVNVNMWDYVIQIIIMFYYLISVLQFHSIFSGGSFHGGKGTYRYCVGLFTILIGQNSLFITWIFFKT